MNVAIEIHGTITDGLWTPERGESRWAQNAAAVLARAGHHVDAFGSVAGENGGWGACPVFENVRLCGWGDVLGGHHYDVAFDTAWWASKSLPEADKNLLGFFWFKREGSNANKDALAAAARGRVVMPYDHLASEAGQLSLAPAFLPYVMPPRSWWPGLQISTRTPSFFWGNKSPFGEVDRWMDPRHPFNIWADLMLKEVERRGLRTRLLNRNHLRTEHSLVAGYYRALERVSIRDSYIVCFTTMPFGLALWMMARSTVCLNLPWAGSTPLEAALEGCVPLAWRGAFIPLLADACPDKSLVLDAEHPDAAHLREVLDRLLTDDGLRSRVLDAYREALRPYSPENFLKRWEEVT